MLFLKFVPNVIFKTYLYFALFIKLAAIIHKNGILKETELNLFITSKYLLAEKKIK